MSGGVFSFMTDPLPLARSLLAIPSRTGREHAVTAFVAERLAGAGWTVVRQPVADGRENVYAHRGTPRVVFSTHLDVVPPDLAWHEDETTLHGRGACDAKGIAAAMITAAEALVAAGEDDVGVLLLVGEEDGSDGAKAANDGLQPRGRFLINGEPTENRLVTGQKGALRVLVEAEGRAAHSGYPALGVSAVDRLLDVLARIRALALPSDPLLGETTINVGRIEGGVAPNVLAPAAHAVLVIRTVAPTAALRDAIVTAAGDDARVTFPLEIPPMRAPGLPGWEETAVAYASDLPLLGNWGVGYQFGPGTIHVAHTDREHITKADLRESVDRYVALARTLLAQGAA